MSGHSPSGPEGPALEMNMSEVNPALQLSVDYLRAFILLCIKHFIFFFLFAIVYSLDFGSQWVGLPLCK